MKTYLAFYKKPSSKLTHKIFHYGTCLFTLSRYSHVELIIDGVAYSSSARDGGVRSKIIKDINDSGRWDLFEINIDPKFALAEFERRKYRKYDYLGVARFVLPFIPNSTTRDYCSETVSAMCGMTFTEKSPEDVFRALVVDPARQSIPNEEVYND